MQHIIIDKIVTRSWMMSLLMVIATAVIADNRASQSFVQYSIQLVAEQTNPWVLPQPSEEYLNPQQSTRFRQQPSRTGQYPMGRFVTPEILESLKQQQMQTQLMPGSRQNNQLMQQKLPSRQSAPQQSWSISPGQGYYGSPSYGMGYMNPLYDTPVVSPWSSGPDVIYQGESFSDSFSGALPDSSPWVPNEAIDGLPPIHVPPFEGSSNWGRSNSTDSNNNEAGNVDRRVDNNVFNPFTFVPNRSW